MDYSEQSPTHCVLTQHLGLLSNPSQPRVVVVFDVAKLLLFRETTKCSVAFLCPYVQGACNKM